MRRRAQWLSCPWRHACTSRMTYLSVTPSTGGAKGQSRSDSAEAGGRASLRTPKQAGPTSPRPPPGPSASPSWRFTTVSGALRGSRCRAPQRVHDTQPRAHNDAGHPRRRPKPLRAIRRSPSGARVGAHLRTESLSRQPGVWRHTLWAFRYRARRRPRLGEPHRPSGSGQASLVAAERAACRQHGQGQLLHGDGRGGWLGREVGRGGPGGLAASLGFLPLLLPA
jgi:hypothetical protein